MRRTDGCISGSWKAKHLLLFDRDGLKHDSAKLNLLNAIICCMSVLKLSMYQIWCNVLCCDGKICYKLIIHLQPIIKLFMNQAYIRSILLSFLRSFRRF